MWKKNERRQDDNRAKRCVPVYHNHHPHDENILGIRTKREIEGRELKRNGHHKQVVATDTTAPPGFRGHYVTIDSPWADGSPVKKIRNNHLPPWQDYADKRALSGFLAETTRWAKGIADPQTGVINLNVLLAQLHLREKYNKQLYAQDMDDLIWRIINIKDDW